MADEVADPERIDSLIVRRSSLHLWWDFSKLMSLDCRR